MVPFKGNSENILNLIIRSDLYAYAELNISLMILFLYWAYAEGT